MIASRIPRLGMAVTRASKTATRSMSLDFQKLQNDPLDETAHSALAKSCYLNIQWKISKTATVHDAIKLMANHDVGALAVTEGDGDEVVGIISERDYLKKIGVMGRTSKTTTVQEIATMGKSNLISVTLGNPIDLCMKKMIQANVRHLFVRESKDKSSTKVGLISVKDIVKCSIAKHDAEISQLHGFLVNKEQMKGL